MEKNQILCGNSLHLLAQQPEQSFDLVVTDPPYLINYKDNLGRSVANDDNESEVLPVYQEIARVLKPDCYCITFYGWSSIAQFSEAWQEAGLRVKGHIVWPKKYVSRSGYLKYCHESAYLLAKGNPKKPVKPMFDVQRWAYSGNKVHPTQKSVSVIAPLIEHYSDPGDTVLDPFAGSGTTAVAATLTGRDYVCIELEQKYCKLARSRVDQLEKSASVKIN